MTATPSAGRSHPLAFPRIRRIRGPSATISIIIFDVDADKSEAWTCSRWGSVVILTGHHRRGLRARMRLGHRAELLPDQTQQFAVRVYLSAAGNPRRVPTPSSFHRRWVLGALSLIA